MSRILFVLTSHDELGDTGEKTGYFLSEVAHPYHVLRDAGCSIDFVSPQGGAVPMDPSSHDLDDPDNAAFLDDEDAQAALEDTFAPGEVDPDDYDAIYFAGGHGTMWDLPHDEQLAALTQRIYEDGGAVGAVCHGPAGLVNVERADGEPLVAGRTVACFTNEEERAMELDDAVPFLLETQLRERGATIEKADNFEEQVVVDGRLVTGQNPASAKGVGEALARIVRPATSAA